MKKFIVMILCVATFFIGLGGLVDSVGAKFKSDERALELVRLARIAVGGDQAVGNVRSLTITGRATKTFDIEGLAKTEQGDWELNLQLPNQMSKMMKMRRESGNGNEKIENKEVNVVVVRKSELKEKIVAPNGEGNNKKEGTFTMRRADGNEGTFSIKTDGEKVADRRIILYKDSPAGGDFHHNELVRTTLFLFLTPPQGTDVSYTYAGEGNVDGASCDIINAAANGANIRLYLDKNSHLPLMMSYQAPKPFMIKIRKEDAVKADGNGDVKVFRDKLPAPELAEFQIRFSDFRGVGGLQLPHRWTQTVGGKDDETIDVTSYEINPTNIDSKFKEMPDKVFVRTAKPQ